MAQSGGLDAFLQRLGDAIGALQGIPGGAPHRRVWAELGPWLQALTMHAAPAWLTQISAQIPCHVVDYAARQRCNRFAVARCLSCGGATCLDHAFVDRQGEAICYVCASVKLPQQQQQKPPQDPAKTQAQAAAKELSWARKTLKVSASADLDELKAAWRKLSAQWHPDRYHTERERASAEKKFKDVQRAFEILRTERERAA